MLKLTDLEKKEAQFFIDKIKTANCFRTKDARCKAFMLFIQDLFKKYNLNISEVTDIKKIKIKDGNLIW